MAIEEKLVVKRYDSDWEAGRSSDSDAYYTDNHRDADGHLRRARYRDATEDDLAPYMPRQEQHPYRNAFTYAAIDAFAELTIDVAQAVAPYIADALACGAHSAFESAKSKISALFASQENPRLKADEILERHAASEEPASECAIETQNAPSSQQERFLMNGYQARAMFADAITKMLILSMTDIEEDGVATAFDWQSQFGSLKPADIVSSLNRLLASDESLLDDSLRVRLEALLGRQLYVDGSYIPLDEKSIRSLLPPQYWDDEEEER